MDDLLIQSAAEHDTEIDDQLRSLCLSGQISERSEVSSFTGRELIEIMMSLQGVRLDGLSLFLGFMLAKSNGLLNVYFGGRPTPIRNLGEILDLIAELRASIENDENE